MSIDSSSQHSIFLRECAIEDSRPRDEVDWSTLIEHAINGTVHDLDNARLPCPLVWNAHVVQAEVANSCGIDDGGDIRKIVRSLGIDAASEDPFASIKP